MERFTISLATGLATLHAHLDHENCIETAVLRGPTAAVRRFAEALIAERGVRHDKLNLLSIEAGQRHVHGYKPRVHGQSNHHAHLKPAR